MRRFNRTDISWEPSAKQWMVIGFAITGVLFFEWLWIPYELPGGDVRYGFRWDPPRGIDPEEKKLLGSFEAPLHPRKGLPLTRFHDQGEKYFLIQQLCAAGVLLAAIVVYVKLEYR